MPIAFESFVAEHGLGVGPGGLKGIGEAGMLGIAAAIANAIEDASGACLTAMPFTPERVLAALDAHSAKQLGPSK
jgi:CO/xanthine dehydrogenase Mo-binding subunit